MTALKQQTKSLSCPQDRLRRPKPAGALAHAATIHGERSLKPFKDLGATFVAHRNAKARIEALGLP
jgi:hypothetical protein